MAISDILILKIISIPCLFLVCFIFGILPYTVKSCRMNESFLSYANAFSGGLFFGIGIFHLLSESVEKISQYTELPIPYFLAAFGYSLILFIQKVLFGNIVPNAEDYLKNNSLVQKELEKINEGNYQIGVSEEENEEENKNIIEDNSKKVSLIAVIENNDNSTDDINKLDINKSSRASTSELSEQMILKKKRLSGFIMLLALSIHGIFESLSLGIQSDFKSALFLFIALMIHKWSEAFTLGIFFVKANLAKKTFYLLILLFSVVGPVGVIIGIILSEAANELVEGIFLGISTGTFLYVACSEVIIEEFSEPTNRYKKFLLYFLGVILAAGLELFEELA